MLCIWTRGGISTEVHMGKSRAESPWLAQGAGGWCFQILIIKPPATVTQGS